MTHDEIYAMVKIDDPYLRCNSQMDVGKQEEVVRLILTGMWHSMFFHAYHYVEGSPLHPKRDHMGSVTASGWRSIV